MSEEQNYEVDEEGFVTREGVRMVNPFDNEPVLASDLARANEQGRNYAVHAATFTMNVMEQDGAAITEMLDDEGINTTVLAGAVSLMFIQIINKLGENPLPLLWGFIEDQVPGLLEESLGQATAEMIAEGEVTPEEAAAAVERVKAEVSGEIAVAVERGLATPVTEG